MSVGFLCPCFLALAKEQQFIIGRIPAVHDVSRASGFFPTASQSVSHQCRSVSSGAAKEVRGHPRQFSAVQPYLCETVSQCMIVWSLGLPSGGVSLWDIGWQGYSVVMMKSAALSNCHRDQLRSTVNLAQLWSRLSVSAFSRIDPSFPRPLLLSLPCAEHLPVPFSQRFLFLFISRAGLLTDSCWKSFVRVLG